jgi:hypothetical protein
VVIGDFVDTAMLSELMGLDISTDITPNVDYNQNTFAQSSDLVDAETDPNTGIFLDSDVVGFYEYAELDVYESAILVDTILAQG